VASAVVDPGQSEGVRGCVAEVVNKSLTQLPMEYHMADGVTHDEIVAN